MADRNPAAPVTFAHQATKRAATPKDDGPSARVRVVSDAPRFSAQVLAAQSETLDQRAVTLDVDVLQVTQQSATLSNQEQQTTT